MQPGSEKDWMRSLGATAQEQQRAGAILQLEEDLSTQDTEAEPAVQEASFDADQIKQLARQDVNMLAGLAIPATFRFPFPKVLLAAWSLLQQLVSKVESFPQVALGIPRGHGKTTLIKLFILYVILFTERRFILVMCSTEQMAENIIADVVDMLNERNIVSLFGSWRNGIEKDTQNVKKFGYRGRNIILAAIGAEGSVRGLNLKNERPDVMVFDDIQTKECSESKIQSDALERWMIGTAMKAKSPRGCLFIFAGNMFPGPHSLLKKLKTNPTWIKFISGAILADGTALWEDLRSKASLIDELDKDIAMGHPEIFFSEVLNDTEAGINTSTDLAKIGPWPWGEHEQPQGKFIIIDPSNDKNGSDEVSIGLFEVYDTKPGLRDVVCDRFSPGNTVRRALLMALQNNVKVIAVEATAYQYSLLYWFDQIAKELGIIGIQFVDIYSGMHSKNSRISETLKALTASEILIHEVTRHKVIHQIANWNPLKRNNVDGILDLLSYANPVLEKYGAYIATDNSIATLEVGVARVQEHNSCF